MKRFLSATIVIALLAQCEPFSAPSHHARRLTPTLKTSALRCMERSESLASGLAPLSIAPLQARSCPPSMKLVSQIRTGINVVACGGILALICSPVDPVCLLLDTFGRLLKLGWRLAALGVVLRLLAKPIMNQAFKTGVGVMMALGAG